MQDQNEHLEDFLGDFPEIENILQEFLKPTCKGKILRNIFGCEIDSFITFYHNILNETKSPIELKYLKELLSSSPTYGFPIIHDLADYAFIDSHLSRNEIVDFLGLFIKPQCEFIFDGKKYIVDFLLLSRKPNRAVRRTIIETDGHDFHEKTKAQAQADKKRDRIFAKKGFTVLRFTGSEIVKNAESCATETMQIIGRLENV